ncbi:DUF167 domain-containing protein [Candidatus Babeliales bacterium]|nr:DUF167 domain-containing protein [Candidatus Babeliales bacterium]MCF7899696.1 DUF167 domain-containing protein [Candidatus Babeliales bacterium]
MLILDIKVVPNSGKQQFILDKSGIIKCFLKNAPESGKANAELIKFLAEKLETTKDSINILLGATGRKKRIKINLDLTIAQLESKLGIIRQLKIS